MALDYEILQRIIGMGPGGVSKLSEKEAKALLLELVSGEEEVPLVKIKDREIKSLVSSIKEKVTSLKLRAEHIKALAAMGELPTTEIETSIASNLYEEIPIIAEMIALDIREENLRQRERALMDRIKAMK